MRRMRSYPRNNPMLVATYGLLLKLDEIDQEEGRHPYAVRTAAEKATGYDLKNLNRDEGVTYQDMREFIADFLKRHGLDG